MDVNVHIQHDESETLSMTGSEAAQAVMSALGLDENVDTVNVTMAQVGSGYAGPPPVVAAAEEPAE